MSGIREWSRLRPACFHDTHDHHSTTAGVKLGAQHLLWRRKKCSSGRMEHSNRKKLSVQGVARYGPGKPTCRAAQPFPSAALSSLGIGATPWPSAKAAAATHRLNAVRYMSPRLHKAQHKQETVKGLQGTTPATLACTGRQSKAAYCRRWRYASSGGAKAPGRPSDSGDRRVYAVLTVQQASRHLASVMAQRTNSAKRTWERMQVPTDRRRLSKNNAPSLGWPPEPGSYRVPRQRNG
jgi:hypothetical protein